MIPLIRSELSNTAGRGGRKKRHNPLKVHTTEACEGKKKARRRERQIGQRFRETVTETKQRCIDIQVERECVWQGKSV